MNYNLQINKNILKKQKIRKFYNFNFFFNFNINSTIIALQRYKLFINHLKLINLFLNKKSIKINKKTKKDQFKKTTELLLKKINFNKDNYITKNLTNLKEQNEKKKYFKKYKKKKYFTYFNLPILGFTKKSIGSRMGKGKGNIYNWYIQISAGFNILFFFNWEYKLLNYIFCFLKKLLPTKNKYYIKF